MEKYYIAYGSNLNLDQMTHRCPGARPVGTAVLKDYELLFKGSKTGSYLTIEKKEGSEVPVGVWKVNEYHEHMLDRYEGYPAFYYKKDMIINLKYKNGNFKRVKAFVYIMHEDRKLGLPYPEYLQGCARGYSSFGFDLKFLEDALKRSKEEIYEGK